MIELTRAERSKLHLAALRALGDDNGPRAAYAEALAWHGSGGIADLATLYDLAEAIDHFVYQAVHRSDCEHAVIDADALRKVHGTSTTNLALRLAGVRPVESISPTGQRVLIWKTGPEGGPTIAVCLPADLLDKWDAM